MSAGAYRHRFVLEAPYDEPDGAGGFRRSWLQAGNLWAALEPAKADERFAGGRVEQASEVNATIRWRADVEAGMRLRRGARILDIRAVFDPDERRKRRVLVCEEGEG